MATKRSIIGLVEVICAFGIAVATFIVEPLASQQLPWRILAIFMFIEGSRRVYEGTEKFNFTLNEDD